MKKMLYFQRKFLCGKQNKKFLVRKKRCTKVTEYRRLNWISKFYIFLHLTLRSFVNVNEVQFMSIPNEILLLLFDKSDLKCKLHITTIKHDT